MAIYPQPLLFSFSISLNDCNFHTHLTLYLKILTKNQECVILCPIPKTIVENVHLYSSSSLLYYYVWVIQETGGGIGGQSFKKDLRTSSKRMRICSFIIYILFYTYCIGISMRLKSAQTSLYVHMLLCTLKITFCVNLRTQLLNFQKMER